jgi:hypothetical protein
MLTDILHPHPLALVQLDCLLNAAVEPVTRAATVAHGCSVRGSKASKLKHFNHACCCCFDVQCISLRAAAGAYHALRWLPLVRADPTSEVPEQQVGAAFAVERVVLRAHDDADNVQVAAGREKEARET